MLVIPVGSVSLEVGNTLAQEEAGTDDEERAVGVALNNIHVGERGCGRAVNQHEVVPMAHLGNEPGEAVAREQFRGVGRYRAHRQDVQVGIGLRLYDEFVYIVVALTEIVCKTGRSEQR